MDILLVHPCLTRSAGVPIEADTSPEQLLHNTQTESLADKSVQESLCLLLCQNYKTVTTESLSYVCGCVNIAHTYNAIHNYIN